ncbi:hypothetical protein [Nesterenkonia sp. CF4.4]|uniref:hypothetical protein n=1 Tax=Nesterenkonia sp. CF4.4 TaxID=3373079 RepID=UPI003EE64493
MTLAIRRTAALGAAASGLLHLILLGHGHHLGSALAMAGMAIICLPCAGHLWRKAGRRSWTTIAVMNAAMLGVHLWMTAEADQHDSARGDQLSGAAETGVADAAVQAGHAHSLVPDLGPVASNPEASAATLHHVLFPLASGMAALEILLALLGLMLLHRGRDGTIAVPDSGEGRHDPLGSYVR